MLGVINCRREKIFPGKLSKAGMGLRPALDGAGHSHAIDAGLRHLEDAFLLQIFNRQPARRPSA